MKHYQQAARDPVYLKVFWITFEIAFSITLLVLVLSYPLAYVLATTRARTAQFLVLCVLVPFFTSVLVRTYAWMVILSPQGILNSILGALGLDPFKLLYNRAGVLLAMGYTLLPYMVLTLYSVMRGIDRELLRAAHNLGASDWQAFRRVFLPLSLPGVAGGSLLVFMLALGYFVTPRLVGGDRDQMIAMVIEEQISMTVNWHFAAALSVLLLSVTLVGFVVYNRMVGFRSLLESRTS